MANYTGIPANLTLTNLKTSEVGVEKVWNTGLDAVNGGPAVLDKEVAARNAEIIIPVYGNKNLFYHLGAGESITVTCTTDEQAIFYLEMASKDLAVAAAGATEASEGDGTADAGAGEGTDEGDGAEL